MYHGLCLGDSRELCVGVGWGVRGSGIVTSCGHKGKIKNSKWLYCASGLALISLRSLGCTYVCSRSTYVCTSVCAVRSMYVCTYVHPCVLSVVRMYVHPCVLSVVRTYVHPCVLSVAPEPTTVLRQGTLSRSRQSISLLALKDEVTGVHKHTLLMSAPPPPFPASTSCADYEI